MVQDDVGAEVAAQRCTFCEIVARRLPASLIHEDDLVVAFLDIHPVNPGHALVVPKDHFPSLEVLPDEVGARMFVTAQRVARAVRRSGLRCDGVNLYLADGAAAGQDVFHCHLHVRPRWRGDAVRVSYELGHPLRDELDAQARRIASALTQSPDDARRSTLADGNPGR
jgi:diadenosine tetraphosphate (Ap4A) HIT family hydrolase